MTALSRRDALKAGAISIIGVATGAILTPKKVAASETNNFTNDPFHNEKQQAEAKIREAFKTYQLQDPNHKKVKVDFIHVDPSKDKEIDKELNNANEKFMKTIEKIAEEFNQKTFKFKHVRVNSVMDARMGKHNIVDEIRITCAA